MKIILSIVAFAAVVGLADLQGQGHGYAAVLALAGVAVIGADLPRRAWRAVFATILAISVAMAVLAAVQIHFMPRSRGIFGSPNFLGGYAVLMLFLALHRGGRIGSIAAVANAASLALAQGLGSCLALAAGLVVLCGRRRPCWTVAACSVVIATGTYGYLARTGTEPRLGLWQLGLEIASQRLILGWGQNAIMIWPNGWDHFYSVPIEWLVWSGVCGVAAGTWMIVAALRAAHRLGEPALVAFIVAWIVNGLFIFDTAATSIPLFAVLSYLASEQGRVQPVARTVNHGQPLLHGRV